MTGAQAQATAQALSRVDAALVGARQHRVHSMPQIAQLRLPLLLACLVRQATGSVVRCLFAQHRLQSALSIGPALLIKLPIRTLQIHERRRLRRGLQGLGGVR